MHTPMVPGPVWVPTTGPRLTTTSGCSASTPSSMLEEVVDVGGRAVADGHPADRRRIPWPCRPGSWSERARVRCFDSSSTTPSTRVHDRLDGQQRAEQGPGPSDPAALLEVLEGVDHPEHRVRGISSLGPAVQLVEGGAAGGQLGGVEDHQTQAHGHRAGVDDPDRDPVGHRLGRGHGGLVGGRHRRRTG